MNLKKIKILGIIITFIIAFPLHFLYNIFPNTITSIFTPVNESIWEHMKIIFTAQIIYTIIEYFILKHYKIKVSNQLFNAFFISFISIPIYLIIYLPLYQIFKENMFISISLMFLIFTLAQYLSYIILTKPNIKYLNLISIPLIIICYSIFIKLTYNPPKNYIFYDTKNKIYGIEKKATK